MAIYLTRVASHFLIPSEYFKGNKIINKTLFQLKTISLN